MTAGRVTAVWGSAFYRLSDGSLKAVRVGDELISGQQVLTNQDGIVEIAPKVLSAKLMQLIQAAAEVDRTIKNIELRDPELVPAAGFDPIGGGSLLPGVRVERIAEVVSPLSFESAGISSPLVSGVSAQSFVPLAVAVDEPVPEHPLAQVPENERPVPVMALTVSEEGLTSGLPDFVGLSDTTNLNSASVQVTLPSGSPRAGLELFVLPQDVRAASGQKLIWLSDGHSGLIGKTVDDPTAPNVVAAQWDEVSGQVTVTLLAPLQHRGEGEDVLMLQFGLKQHDDDVPVAVVYVQVEDDAPIAYPQPEPVAVDGTNLMLVVDLSAGLQASRQALEAVVDRYAHLGPVAVRLVTVSDQVKVWGDQWVSASVAKSLLSGLTAHAGHDYDGALDVAQAAFMTETGRLPHATNVSYFVAGSSMGIDAVDSGEEAAWVRFLADHHILSHAVGLGVQVSADDVDPIAYDGQLLQSMDAVLVPDVATLSDVVSHSVVSPIRGSLLEGVNMGADGLGLVHSITVGGHQHLADPSLPVMAVTTGQGGTLTVDVQTGQYTYVPPVGVQTYKLDEIGYTLVDRDGDQVSATLNAVVNRFETIVTTNKADILVGHDGTDVFTWGFSDPNVTIPASLTIDHVVGFKLGQPSKTGADVLDLRDLLQGEHAGSGGQGLSHFIQISSDSTGSQLHISTTGRFDAPTSQPKWNDPTIVIDGVDLRAGLGLAAGASSADVINKLIAQGQLYVDP